jgi:hypothetical protein
MTSFFLCYVVLSRVSRGFVIVSSSAIESQRIPDFKINSELEETDVVAEEEEPFAHKTVSCSITFPSFYDPCFVRSIP